MAARRLRRRTFHKISKFSGFFYPAAAFYPNYPPRLTPATVAGQGSDTDKWQKVLQGRRACVIFAGKIKSRKSWR